MRFLHQKSEATLSCFSCFDAPLRKVVGQKRNVKRRGKHDLPERTKSELGYLT